MLFSFLLAGATLQSEFLGLVVLYFVWTLLWPRPGFRPGACWGFVPLFDSPFSRTSPLICPSRSPGPEYALPALGSGSPRRAVPRTDAGQALSGVICGRADAQRGLTVVCLWLPDRQALI